MRIKRVYIENFKNLKKFSIEFDNEEMKTVLIGQNATGKSNFFEAIILIFKYLDLSDELKRLTPEFEYNIIYTIKNYVINISQINNHYSVLINDKEVKSLKHFFSEQGKKIYQPKYIFTYYSGVNDRLKEMFFDHQKRFYDGIIKEDFQDNEIEQLRKLFYVQLIHSYFVLLAFFSFDDEEKSSLKFLNSVLHIKDIESILFVLKRPVWSKGGRNRNTLDIFWTAKGLVRKFLDILWINSTAPIYNIEQIRIDFGKPKRQENLYLFLKGKEQLKKIASFYKSNTQLFKALESTYISDMIHEVRVKIRKENINGNVTFRELSEGEQQILTVLGLLKFTKEEESLILLDEPDTHLNPLWKWGYLEYLENVVKRPNSTQILINTHDPLVIGSLKKEEVRLFRDKNGIIITEQPDIDPRGLGVDGILTSEMFGLSTTLDELTVKLLDDRNKLLLKQQKKKLTDSEKLKMRKLFSKLRKLGFSDAFRDPLYRKFIIASKNLYKNNIENNYTKEDLQKQNKLAMKILQNIEKEKKK